MTLDLPPLTPPAKRSLSIDGHATSVSLEEAFWRAAQQAAATRGMTRAQLIAAIDHARPAEVGLATAIRLFLLAEAQHHAGAPAPTRDDP
ncbi:ribbon-helix-helix domain-containing protein [Paracoccus salipaludis]|uniref:Ribbon-helix-helix domain-containing protein n=1 Tax=Paracoccus salipaludis TaxID=2032623 RepID=A0A2A2GML2_9RHOB|nr:ribbon-helix-helix domain-containing protein [Paracoccus salipaludis]PAU98197.1 hypothetical protein CK240_03130 [Paracoccus salipaludis]